MIRKTSATLLLYLLLIVLSLVVLFPFFWMVTTSLKSGVDMFASPPVWIPNPPTLENYASVLFGGDSPPRLGLPACRIASAESCSSSLLQYACFPQSHW